MQNQEAGKQRQIIQQKSIRSGNIIKRYIKGRLLGKGGFAKCYEVQSVQTNKKYAAKIIEKASLIKSKAKEKLASEIKIHKGLRSPYVVGFQHFFEDNENVYILLELCPNQTLNELVKRRKRILQIEAKYYVFQIVNAIKDIHSQKVIHRDLKLGNLFLTDKLEIRIGDFGLAAKLNFDGQKRKTMCGTPNYIAPQILQANHGHSYQVDIWSLGVITYAFLVGRPPFQTNDVKATYSKIKQCNYSFPQNFGLSKTAKNFISKMLQRDPSRRSTLDQILNDDFFTQCSFPKTIPISTLACPPNSNFIKQFVSNESIQQKITKQEVEAQTARDSCKSRKNLFNTQRGDSTGKVLVRANSIDRVQIKNQGVQRAVSTAGLMGGRKISSNVQNKINYESLRACGPLIWVTYSEENQKFGVCYLLNSNAVGMRFNDSTCLISNSTFTRIKYIDHYLSQSKPPQIYNVNEVPQSLNKKMKIITHYHRQLVSQKKQMQELMSNDQRIERQRLKYRQNIETAMSIYVVKYFKTTKVNIFWFNNKDYQVTFKDSTQLLISQNNVIYVNKLGQRKYFLTNNLEEQSQQIKKRMNYTISIIQKMRNSTSRNVQQKENHSNHPIVRSSSVTKVQPKTQILRGSASTTRFVNCKLIK